jgi:hypothetical protein
MIETALVTAGTLGVAGLGVFAAGNWKSVRNARVLKQALLANEPRKRFEHVLNGAHRSHLGLWRHGGSNVLRLHEDCSVTVFAQRKGDTFSEASIDHLLELCDTDPEAGLKIINDLPTEQQAMPIILLCRLVAHRRLIFGPPEEMSEQFGENLRAFVDSLSARKRQLAIGSLALIKAIEQGDASLLRDDSFGIVADSICIVVEWCIAGHVQAVLGWTKLIYFPPERALVLTGPASVIEELNEVPDRVQQELLGIKIRPPVPFRLVVALSARSNASGSWSILVGLFKRGNLPRNGRLAGAGLQGFVTLYQGGNWRFDRS